MNKDLYRLVYYSRNRMPEEPISASVLNDILATSRRNNARVDVTGALMFNGGCFGQVLEGPQGAVEDTFERIQQDDRHGEVALLAFGPADGRAFETWSMGYVGASAEARARFADISDRSGFDLSKLSGERLFETLRDLALEQEQGAAPMGTGMRG